MYKNLQIQPYIVLPISLLHAVDSEGRKFVSNFSCELHLEVICSFPHINPTLRKCQSAPVADEDVDSLGGRRRSEEAMEEK